MLKNNETGLSVVYWVFTQGKYAKNLHRIYEKNLLEVVKHLHSKFYRLIKNGKSTEFYDSLNIFLFFFSSKLHEIRILNISLNSFNVIWGF